MQRFLDLASSRDETAERRALSGILAQRSIPAGFVPEMCVGDNRILAQALVVQWTEHHEINPDSIPSVLLDTLIGCLQLSPDCGEIALADLRAHSARRAIGNAMVHANTSVDPLIIARTIQDQMANVILGASIDEEYDHHREVIRLLQVLEAASLSGREIAGTGIGLPDFDSVLGGFERDKFYLLGALKKTGKSRFMIHCAAMLSQADHGVLIDSLEMNRIQLLSCGLGWCADLNTSLMATAMPKREYSKMAIGMGPLDAMHWHICRDRTVPELRARIHQARSKGSVDFVFVDFLQRMRSTRAKAGDRVREVEEVSMDLADLSREMRVGVIALCQLSGEAEKLDDDEIPNMQYIKESQAAAENADTIITMHNPNRKKTEFTGGEYHAQSIMFRIEQRYGLSGKIVKALGDLRTCRFTPDADNAGEGTDGFSEPGTTPRAQGDVRRPYID
jgi:replicative DNA helicase